MFNSYLFRQTYNPWCFPTNKPNYDFILQQQKFKKYLEEKPIVKENIIIDSQWNIDNMLKIIHQKTYLLVTTNDEDVTTILKNMNIEILDKTCIEEYKIYSIKCSEYKMTKLKKYNWCVNISNGQ
ncbi:hypothetical protein QKU48_gp0925 [Fadolivirus algeromassiliense]|jgi:hypothetical protein|uniref:Uncharacterized protein n=1 Tax=Fadolivirus FV1/VV64 TaxID=3070911 RepID=A0A7D3QUT0_9VIRU|nr:hypothetical protein QKU48_gp0925 [Fadolivirus algeromassiliense]QKF94383.1 hypothetical protein Fadolivirus_1_925 [Fadolivirus FV1/VV64]